MPKELKTFYRTVGENEGAKCHYPTRLDTYGCGCSHDCRYCYAKSQLSIRKNWDPQNPAHADLAKIRLQISKLKPGIIVRLGGMTDCFQPIEKIYGLTYETIKILNEYRIGYLIVTKSDLIAEDKYLSVLDKSLAHIQISITATDDDLSMSYEKAVPPSKRIKAIEKLYKAGFDVSVRLSPLIPQYVDFDVINSINCDKILVEFLRNDSFIKKCFPIDWSDWTISEGGYGHLPLEIKKQYLSKITTYSQISVCEDCSEHYDYWRDHYNPNSDDCCNLSISPEIHSLNETTRLQLIDARSQPKRRVLNKKKNIRITLEPEIIIQGENASQTFELFIEQIGPGLVRNLNIQLRGSNVVCESLDEIREVYREQAAKHVLSNGMYLFSHMSTEVKIDVILSVSQKLNRSVTIEYV